VLLSLSVFFSCKDPDIADPAPDGYTVGTTSINYNTISPVSEIDFGSYDAVEITVDGSFTGQNMYLVKMNTNDYIVGSGTAGYIISSNISEPTIPVDRVRAAVEQTNLPEKKDHTASIEFLNLFEPLNNSSVFVPSRSIAPEKEALVDYGDGITYSIGDIKPFYVEDASGAFISIDAELKVEGYYSYIWVPILNFDNSSVSNKDNKLTQVQLTSLANKFDGTLIEGYDDGIYKLVTNVCGYEYGGGVDGNGGKDEDKHINILVYDIDDDFTPTQSGGVYGYFWGKDYESDADTLAWWGIRSNESEIFYIDSHFYDLDEQGIYSTLAHEFQHMINFNRKSLEKGLYPSTWFNEMLSMLVEDIMKDKLNLSDPASPISRTAEFVDGYYLSGITDWLAGWPDVLDSYASSFIFGAFLTRNFGGADLIKAMMDSNSVDQQSVTDALASSGYNTETFDSVFNKYSTALIYSAQDSSNEILVTNTSSGTIVSSITYNQSAFNIYDYENSALYNGPLLFTINSQMDLRPRGMSVHSDNTWTELDGSDTLHFTISSPESGVNYYLMFK
jgi:hypothetical protein